MKLDTMALSVIVLGAAAWALLMLVGMLALFPVGLIGLAIYGVAGFFLYRVMRERLANREDDYYDRNVDR